MKPGGLVFQKVFVLAYYKQNTSFFLLVIGLAGGFMRSDDHIALAEFFVSSHSLLLIPFAIWAIYTFKVINFNAETIARSENEFLYSYILLPKTDQWVTLIVTVFSQLAPATVYGIFLMAVAFKHGIISTVVLVLIALILLTILASITVYRTLHHPDQERKVSAIKKFFDRLFSKPYPLFFIEWIVRRQPLMLIGGKVFSAAVLLGVMHLYTTDKYDYRLLAMGIVLASAANATLLLELHLFENFHFSVIRQLPISFFKRFSYTITTVFLLTLTEIGLLITYFPDALSLVILLQSILFLIAINIFIYGFLYWKNRNQEQLMPFIFGLTMSLIVLVLFKIPLTIFIVFHMVAGIYLWRKYYFGFEYTHDKISS
jgi:hypothetical protein